MAPDGAAAIGSPVTSTGAARGDAEFGAFVAAHYGRLLHMADLLVGDRSKAEDLLQGVLVRTYRRWSRVRQDNPLGYVRAALANARTDLWRRGGRERPSGDLAEPEHGLVPDHAGQVVGRDAVQRALSVLTALERTVIVIRFYEDLSEADIARTLDIAPGTVKSTCARALAKLRISPDLTTDVFS